jgi:hypothetical protein
MIENINKEYEYLWSIQIPKIIFVLTKLIVLTIMMMNRAYLSILLVTCPLYT